MHKMKRPPLVDPEDWEGKEEEEEMSEEDENGAHFVVYCTVHCAVSTAQPGFHLLGGKLPPKQSSFSPIIIIILSSLV